MNLQSIKDFDLTGKGVILRVDLDVPVEKTREEEDTEWGDKRPVYRVLDESRLESFIPCIKLILEKKAAYICLIGHIGRYQGKFQVGVDTGILAPIISKLIGEPVGLIMGNLHGCDQSWDFEHIVGLVKEERQRVLLAENLRWYPGEEKNDLDYADLIATLGNFYVNDAFATSHREHASIVSLPKLMPHAAGLRLVKEVEYLSKVLENPKRPVVVIIGGAKEDKLSYIEPFSRFADRILIGGKLPVLIPNYKLPITSYQKLVVAELNDEGTDITPNTVEMFSEIIKSAGTIVLAGPMGKFEDENSQEGTKRIFQAVADSSAFKVTGGGETEAAISMLKLNEKFDWISSGGGAMLEFLARGDLPGLKALRV